MEARIARLELKVAELERRLGAKRDGPSDQQASDGIWLKSKFAGTCKGCKDPITVGDDVLWKKGQGSWCAKCGPRQEAKRIEKQEPEERIGEMPF